MAIAEAGLNKFHHFHSWLSICILLPASHCRHHWRIVFCRSSLWEVAQVAAVATGYTLSLSLSVCPSLLIALYLATVFEQVRFGIGLFTKLCVALQHDFKSVFVVVFFLCFICFICLHFMARHCA